MATNCCTPGVSTQSEVVLIKLSEFEQLVELASQSAHLLHGVAYEIAKAYGHDSLQDHAVADALGKVWIVESRMQLALNRRRMQFSTTPDQKRCTN